MPEPASPSVAPHPADRVLAGVGLMLTGIFFFALNDAMGKYLVATFSVGQVLLIRSIAGLAVLTPFIAREGRAAFTAAPRRGIQLLRAVLLTLEVAAFYWALTSMPLADVMTFYLAGPIYVTAMSPFLLGEKVGWRRWSAVAAGFIGVMIALDPSGQSLSPAALVAIAGSLMFSMSMICTRLVRGTSDIALITAQTAAALVFGAVTSPFVWVAVSWMDGALLVLLGVVATFAHFCINRALKLAPASVVVPYQYTTIVWAVLLGYVFFGDVPSWHMVAGAAIIIGAGIYIFFREQVRGRQTAFADPP
ncbi:MAG: Permease of the drug/metabolite transporter (DMT) superfamily [Pseudolabrys sp.]|jgi:drug/metabolite transporter (DMT)-like permease|nr:Permease of the drug/metabolite transporter (DMT) superfamily [Pseudolabrys sp.]